MALSNWNDEQLKKEYKRLVQRGWERSIDIAKRRKERHERIDFDNPLFTNQIKQLEDEMKVRGLK